MRSGRRVREEEGESDCGKEGADLRSGERGCRQVGGPRSSGQEEG